MNKKKNFIDMEINITDLFLIFVVGFTFFIMVFDEKLGMGYLFFIIFASAWILWCKYSNYLKEKKEK